VSLRRAAGADQSRDRQGATGIPIRAGLARGRRARAPIDVRENRQAASERESATDREGAFPLLAMPPQHRSLTVAALIDGL